MTLPDWTGFLALFVSPLLIVLFIYLVIYRLRGWAQAKLDLLQAGYENDRNMIQVEIDEGKIYIVHSETKQPIKRVLLRSKVLERTGSKFTADQMGPLVIEVLDTTTGDKKDMVVTEPQPE